VPPVGTGTYKERLFRRLGMAFRYRCGSSILRQVFIQRSDRGLRTGKISTFEFGQQMFSLLFRAGLSHDLAAMDRF
jgi:hypothetical protein